MVTVKHILCPVDFSETSRHAFEHATHFARQCHAELTVLHVVEEAPLMTAYGGVPDVSIVKEIQDVVEEKLHALTRAPEAAGLAITREIRHGSTHRSILSFAADRHMDLIVMGTHGRSGLDHAFFGSVAEKVIRRASCPVLIVRLPGAQADASPVAER